MENLALETLLRELSQQAQMALDVAVDAQQRAAAAVVGRDSAGRTGVKSCL